MICGESGSMIFGRSICGISLGKGVGFCQFGQSIQRWTCVDFFFVCLLLRGVVRFETRNSLEQSAAERSDTCGGFKCYGGSTEVVDPRCL
jgi:hypothetical protein